MDKLLRPPTMTYLVRWPKKGRASLTQAVYTSLAGARAKVARLEAGGWTRDQIYVWSASLGTWREELDA